MIKDCKHKPHQNCEQRPGGVHAVVHCVTCYFNLDRLKAESDIAEYNRQVIEIKAEQQAKIDRLKAENEHFKAQAHSQKRVHR